MATRRMVRYLILSLRLCSVIIKATIAGMLRKRYLWSLIVLVSSYPTLRKMEIIHIHVTIVESPKRISRTIISIPEEVLI